MTLIPKERHCGRSNRVMLARRFVYSVLRLSSFERCPKKEHRAATLSGMQTPVDLHQYARRSARDHGMLVRFALANRRPVRRGLPTGVFAPLRFVSGQEHCGATLMSAFGTKRTSGGGASMSAYDPKRTLATRICCDAQPLWRCGRVQASA